MIYCDIFSCILILSDILWNVHIYCEILKYLYIFWYIQLDSDIFRRYWDTLIYSDIWSNMLKDGYLRNHLHKFVLVLLKMLFLNVSIVYSTSVRKRRELEETINMTYKKQRFILFSGYWGLLWIKTRNLKSLL